MNVFKYIYYRLVRFYKKTFGIDDSPGFLIQSCYSWGLLLLLTSICFYLMSFEIVVLWSLGVKTKKGFILLTFLLFALFHIFSEHWIGDEKKFYNDICEKYKNESFVWLKGMMVFLFVVLSLPCYITTLFLCK